MDGRRAIIASNQIGLKNLMLSHARKWHRATLIIPTVRSAGRSMNGKSKTYAFWQTNNGIHWAIALEEVITIWIVVLAHELDFLF